MFCTRCGTKNPDGGRFCEKCGGPLGSAGGATAPTPAPARRDAPPSAAKPASGPTIWRPWVIAGGVVAVLAAIAVVANVLTVARHKSTESATTAVPPAAVTARPLVAATASPALTVALPPGRGAAMSPDGTNIGTNGLPPRSVDANALALCFERKRPSTCDIENLLKQGADPNARGVLFSALGDEEVSLETVSALLKAGADPNFGIGDGAPGPQYTMLEALAARCGYAMGQCGGMESAVSLMAQAGTDLNARNSSRETALMRAALMDRAELAVALLAHGADPSLRDEVGWTALDFALSSVDKDKNVPAPWKPSPERLAALDRIIQALEESCRRRSGCTLEPRWTPKAGQYGHDRKRPS